MAGSRLGRSWSDKVLGTVLLLAGLTATVACGGGTNSPAAGPMNGNWQITLHPHGVFSTYTYTGFLTQNGSSVAGALILNDGCAGVGQVTGTVNGQNLTLNVNEFGQDLSLVGSLASGSQPAGGQYSAAFGACFFSSSSTGTWTAVQVAPLNGSFNGTLTPASTGGTGNTAPPIPVTGSLTQGPNNGSSMSTISGTITATASAQFCTYLSTATITGGISGDSVTLNLFAPDGTLLTIIPATLSADGSSLSGTYAFPQLSSGCTGQGGTMVLTLGG